jgi:hypothetical protein
MKSENKASGQAFIKIWVEIKTIFNTIVIIEFIKMNLTLISSANYVLSKVCNYRSYWL